MTKATAGGAITQRTLRAQIRQAHADLEARFTELADDPAIVHDELAKLVGRSPGALEKVRSGDDGYEVAVTSYEDIEAQITHWLWDRKMPQGALSLLVGTEGLGKTAFGLYLAAQMTRGTLPGDLKGKPVNVALFTPEDDPARTIKPRLAAAGADMARVKDVKMRKDASDRGFSLPDDTEKIMRALVKHEVRFVFADPLASMLDPRLNSWKDTDVRKALEPLVGLCAEHGITLLGSLHTNKSSSTDARSRGMGSAGWRQIIRASFLVGLDPDDKAGAEGSARCVAHDKHNLGPWTKTRRFTLDTASVQVQGKGQDVVRATLGEECDVRANAMLAAEQGHEDTATTKTDQAAAWLSGQLDGGPMAVGAIKDAAEAAGYSNRTLERAKRDLGIEAFQPKGVRGWSWRMSEGAIPL